MNDEQRVELLRRGFEAWNADDLEAFVERLEPDVAIRLTGAFPGLQRAYDGHDGVRAFWGEFRSMWTSIEIQLEEAQALDGLVLAVNHFRGVGREGIEVEQRFYFLFEFSDRKVAAWSAFPSREAAIGAARDAGGKLPR